MGMFISGSSTSTGSFHELHIKDRIGIGITSGIDAQLHIAGATWNNSLVIQGNSTVSGIVFEDSSANKLGYVYAADTGFGFLDDDAAWAIRHVTDTNTEFRINNSVMANLTTTGLGIGQSSPSYKLDVAGTGRFTDTLTLQGGGGTLNGDGANLGGVIDVDIGSQTANQGSRIKLNAGHGTGEFIIQARQATGYSNGNIGIYRRSGVTAYSTIMHIGGDGKIGIGTESPSQKLEVAGAALINNGSSNHHLYFGNTSYGIHVVHSTGVMNFVSNSSTRMSIANGGDISTAGSIVATGNLTTGGQILSPGGANIALNPNTGLVTIANNLQLSGYVQAAGNLVSTGANAKISGSSSSTGSFGRVEIAGKIKTPEFADLASTVSSLSSGGVSKTGTPADNQVAVFTDSSTVEGTSALVYDGTALSGLDRTSYSLTSSGGSFITVTHSGNEAWSFGCESGAGSTDYLDIGINGGRRCIVLQEDGHIGIGLTAPATLLHLYEASAAAEITLERNSSAATIGVINWKNDNGNVIAKIHADSHNATAGRIMIGTSGGFSALKVETDGSVHMTKDLTVAGKVTAQEFHTEFVSASIQYSSGSTQFGDSSGDTHKFTGLVGINESSPDEALHITSTAASATPVILLENSNENNLAPQLNLYNNSASPAVNDYVGQIDFEGNDSGDNRTQYARIIAEANNVTNGTEDGILDLQVARDGSLTTGLRLRGTSGGAYVGIGETNPTQKLDVNGNIIADSLYLVDTNTRLHEGGGNTLRITNDSGYVDIGPMNSAYCHIYTDRGGFFLDSSIYGAISLHLGGYGTEKINMSYDGNYGKIYSSGGVPLSLGSNGDNNRLVIDTSGRVGIGTTSPTSGRQLEVHSDTDTYIQISTSNAGADTWLKFRNDGDDDSNTDFRMGRTNTGIFMFGDGDGDTHYTVASNGDITFGSVTKTSHAKVTIQSNADNNYDAILQFNQETTMAWQLYNDASDSDKFKIGDDDGTVRMTVMQSGNVGIGTTTPAGKLQVAGDIIIAQGSKLKEPDGNAYISFDSSYHMTGSSAGDIVFDIDNNGNETNSFLRITKDNQATQLFKIDESGHVGIGAEHMSGHILHINSGDTIVSLTETGGNSGAYLDLGRSKGSVGSPSDLDEADLQLGMIRFMGRESNGERMFANIQAFTGGVPNGASYPGYLTFSTTATSATSPSERMRIDKDGKVGIGTTSPGAILDARATAASSWLALHTYGQNRFYTTTTDGSELRFQFDMGGSSDPASMNLYGADGSTVKVHLDAGDDSYFNGGDLGIGTTSPDTKLHVYNLGAGLKVQAAGEAPYTQKIAEFNYIGNGGSLFIEQIGGRPAINTNGGNLYLGTGGYARIAVDTSGNVGIGTTSPDYQLELEKAGGGFLSFKTTDTDLQNNDVLGTIQFAADDATHSGIDIGAKIVATVTDNYQSAGSNVDAPTRLDFFTQDNTTTDVMSTVGATLTLGGDDQSSIFRGPVGISTTPERTLHVNAQTGDYVAKFESSDGYAGIILEDNSSTNDGNRIAAIGDSLRFDVGNSAKVYIDSNGLGIGGSPGAAGLDVSSGHISLDYSYALSFEGPGGNTSITSNATDTLAFLTGGSNRMAINANGNIIIAHTAPAGMANSSYKQIALNNGGVIADSGGTNSSFQLMQNAYVGASNNNYYTVDSYASQIMMTLGDIYFRTAATGTADNQITWQERMFIDQSTGRIGMGTTSPDVALHLHHSSAGTVDSYSGVHFTLESSANTAMQFLTAENSDTRIWFGDAANNTAGGILYTHNATATAEHMELRVNAATRLKILGSGNVGIGTTSPDALLHLSSANTAIKVETTNAANVAMVRFQTNGNDWYWAAGGQSQGYFPNKMYLYNESTAKNPITIQNDDKIGIGSNNRSPSYQLDNNSTARTTGKAYFENFVSITPNWGRFGVGMDGFNDPQYTIHAKIPNGVGSSTVSSANLMNNNTMGLVIENANNGANTGMKLGFRSTGTYTGDTFIWHENTGTDGQGRMAFWTETGGTAYERMRIDHNGNVGIGVTDPDSKLEVNGNVKIDGGDRAILFGGQNMKIIGNTSSPALELRGGVSGGVKIFCDETVRWTWDDGGDLAANGARNITTTGIIQAATLRATADVVAYYSSDERLKENIKEIENPIEKVKQIRGVEFDWKEGNEEVHGFKGHDVGVIAQDVEKVMPEVVKDREDGYKGVKYEKMVGLLIEGMKEQQKQIEELKSEIQELKDGSS